MEAFRDRKSKIWLIYDKTLYKEVTLLIYLIGTGLKAPKETPCNRDRYATRYLNVSHYVYDDINGKSRERTPRQPAQTPT
jgi:hypothetical protein